MTKKPSLKDQNIGVFFSRTETKPEKNKSTIPEQENSRTIKTKKSRKLQYQKKWESAGKTQISLWLPSSLVQKLKIQAVMENKKMSQLATDILSNTLQNK